MTLKFALKFTIALLALLPALRAAEDVPKTGQHAYTFEKNGAKFDYLLYLPPDYNKDETKKWPLIVFLHGSGERGTDVNDVKRHGPPKIVEDKDSPLAGRFIVLSPQCPPKDRWRAEDLNKLLADVLDHYRIDKTRLYLTGLSMGGFGTWSWAELNPNRFAAIAPMCGGGDPTQADKLRDLPIWVFHGELDKTVPIERDQEMVDAVRLAGHDKVKFTKYPDAGHDCWTRSYANPELYDWFLKHKRGAASPAGE